ncbi:MAG TPA: hypothetical protein VM639_00880 [Dongiaceae bacterium]|nr:hypothetical protein [Dongiaceae bacterium]
MNDNFIQQIRQIWPISRRFESPWKLDAASCEVTGVTLHEDRIELTTQHVVPDTLETISDYEPRRIYLGLGDSIEIWNKLAQYSGELPASIGGEIVNDALLAHEKFVRHLVISSLVESSSSGILRSTLEDSVFRIKKDRSFHGHDWRASVDKALNDLHRAGFICVTKKEPQRYSLTAAGRKYASEIIGGAA